MAELDLSRPFTRREFRSAGFDERRLRSKEFRSIFREIYVLACVPDSVRLRARAALRIAGPQAHASHHTAAALHDLCPPDHPATHASTPKGVPRTRTRGIEPHEANPSCRVLELPDGLRVSSPVQTFLDLAGHQAVTLVDLVVVGDRLIRKELTTTTGLVKAADAWTGRGRRLARRAARLVRTGVDSPMETRLRLLIVLAGLPEPRVNLIMRWPDGSWRFRLDLSYPKQKVIIEYDGRQHGEVREQWLHDIKRLEQLHRWGWHIVRVTSEGVFDDPLDTLQRVHAIARERKVPGTPRRISDEWRHYFVSRESR
jgi:hypothetical protein